MNSTNDLNAVVTALAQLTNLVAVAITRGMKQPDAIDLLGRASLANDQIAAILDTTADTVRATQSRIRRAQPAARRPARHVPAEA